MVFARRIIWRRGYRQTSCKFISEESGGRAWFRGILRSAAEKSGKAVRDCARRSACPIDPPLDRTPGRGHGMSPGQVRTGLSVEQLPFADGMRYRRAEHSAM